MYLFQMKKFKVEHPDVHALPRWAKRTTSKYSFLCWTFHIETVDDVATYVIELC
jgi:hypothetical protein